MGMVLLVAFGLLLCSFVHVESSRLGYDPNNVLTATIRLPFQRYADPSNRARLMQAAVERMRSMPGVESVGIADSLPMQGAESAGLRIEATPNLPPIERETYFVSVNPNYFSTLKIPMLSGRAFRETDTETSNPVAIVNRTFAKQFFPDELDKRLTQLALERIGDAVVIHPLVMYSRMRFVLELMQPVEAVTRIGEYRELLLEDRRLPPGCPADYVAVKLYFSDSFPDDEASRALAARLLGELAERTDVVVLTSGRQLDEHREWVPEGARIHDSSSWVTPQDNLAVQTAVVAGARELVATYGGFSYLGPMLAVPTRALWTQEVFQRVHLDVLRAAYPDAGYELVGPS